MSVRGSLEIQSTRSGFNYVSEILEPGLKAVIGIGFLGFQITESVVHFVVKFCEAPQTSTTQKVAGLGTLLNPLQPSPAEVQTLKRIESPFHVESVSSTPPPSPENLELALDDLELDSKEHQNAEVGSDAGSDEDWEKL